MGAAPTATARIPICLLLLPAPLERFILRDQAEDLLRARGVVAVDPPRCPTAPSARLPAALGDGLAARQARRLVRALRRRAGDAARRRHLPPAAVPAGARGHRRVGRRSASSGTGAGTATSAPTTPRPRCASASRSCTSHAAERASLTFVGLRRARPPRAARPGATPRSCRCRPTPSRRRRGGAVVAVSLGHLGRRTDWALLRAVAERARRRPRAAARRRAGTRTSAPTTPTSPPAGRSPTSSGSGAARRRGGGAADPRRRRRHRPVQGRGVQRRRRCPTGSSSTPALGRRTVAPALAGVRTWARAVTVAQDAAGVRRGAARARRRAAAPRRRAARVGAGPDRARPRTSRCGSAWARSGIDLSPKPR